MLRTKNIFMRGDWLILTIIDLLIKNLIKEDTIGKEFKRYISTFSFRCNMLFGYL
jgi:hypothetical protein